METRSNPKIFRIFVALLAIFLIFLFVKRRYVSKEIVQEEQTSTLTVTPVEITPVPQDPSKPKLTTDFIKTINAQYASDIKKYKLGQPGGILSYTENDTNNDQSGQIGKYIYSIETRKPTGDDLSVGPSTLTLKEGSNEVFKKVYDVFGSIGSYGIKTKNQITRIFKLYSYGAHCCTSLVPATLKNDKIYVGDPLDVGNTDMVSKEDFFVQDDKLYKIVYDDRFAYYGMSFAESNNMFYPMIYLIDENGFTAIPNEFKNYYEGLYQASKKKLTKIETRLIDWKDINTHDYIFGEKIYTYTLGYLAGHDRQELKEELQTPWPNLGFNELEIFKIISQDLSVGTNSN